MTKYKLELSEQELFAVQEALELVSRLGMGQVEEAAMHSPSYGCETAYELRKAFDALTPLATGLEPGAYHSIHSPEVGEKAKRAFDMYRVIRHRLAYDRNPGGGIQVCYDDPKRGQACGTTMQVTKIEEN